MSMVQVTISLDDAVVVELDAMADRQGMSRAGLVRREVLRALPALRREFGTAQTAADISLGSEVK